MKKFILLVLGLAVILGLGMLLRIIGHHHKSHLTGTVSNDPDLVKRGEYLASMGGCQGCHNGMDGTLYSGGYKMGPITTSNITPDRKTGIGDWSLQDFDKAVRYGYGKGRNLTPAMPYPDYSKIRDEDIRALYAYFMYGVKPVSNDTSPTTGKFKQKLLDAGLQVWNYLNAPHKPYTDKPGQSAEWNRGAYLVQGLNHCGDCHTPHGKMGQELAYDETQKGYLGGFQMGSWYAFNITSDKNAGIGIWSKENIRQYLSEGNVPHLAQAGGEMGAGILPHMTSQMKQDDLQAVATYLASVPAVADDSTRPRSRWGSKNEDFINIRGTAQDNTSDPQTLYLGLCASCHQADGSGTKDGFVPSLMDNSAVGYKSPDNLVNVILFGQQRDIKPGIRTNILMPGFASELNDAEVASLTNYLTKKFGNSQATQVSAGDVKKLRSHGS